MLICEPATETFQVMRTFLPPLVPENKCFKHAMDHVTMLPTANFPQAVHSCMYSIVCYSRACALKNSHASGRGGSAYLGRQLVSGETHSETGVKSEFSDKMKFCCMQS